MKSRLPVIYYMSIKAMEHIAQELRADGWSPDTPVALVFNAGGGNETIIKTTLGSLPDQARSHCIRQPGLILVGDITTYAYRPDLGALRGRRILLTCSDFIQEKAADLVHDFGGRPVQLPLIRLVCRRSFRLDCETYDWIAVTSPSSVHALMQLIEDQKIDLRTLPKIMVCGRGTADAFMPYGIYADAQPDSGYSAESLIALAEEVVGPGEKILRVRSDKAGPRLADALRRQGAEVDDCVIYDNRRVLHDELPGFDAVFFASASAVEAFADQWGPASLLGKTTCVIGSPTARALEKIDIHPDVIAREATVMGAIYSLAAHFVGEELCSRKYD